ncbi:MAG: hypothetical protein QHH04_06340 [Methanolinea sp.]|nr:hypothetical protein [Methanolinea sp.]
MKKLAYTLTLGILLGFLLLVTFPVQAGTSVSANNSVSACGLTGSGPSDRMDRLLDTLEEKGYDMSAIRTALESGDTGTARTLLRQFMQENRDALPVPPEKPARGARAALGVSQAGNGCGPADNNLASAGNLTASMIRHGKGGITQKSTRTA